MIHLARHIYLDETDGIYIFRLTAERRKRVIHFSRFTYLDEHDGKYIFRRASIIGCREKDEHVISIWASIK